MSKLIIAIRKKLRFNTSNGVLSMEQLWDLSRRKLSTILKALKKEIGKNSDDDLAFLDETAAPVDRILQLKFDIVKEIYLTKKEEEDASKNEEVLKEKKARLTEILKKKQDAELEGKSAEEIEKMLAELK